MGSSCFIEWVNITNYDRGGILGVDTNLFDNNIKWLMIPLSKLIYCMSKNRSVRVFDIECEC